MGLGVDDVATLDTATPLALEVVVHEADEAADVERLFTQHGHNVGGPLSVRVCVVLRQRVLELGDLLRAPVDERGVEGERIIFENAFQPFLDGALARFVGGPVSDFVAGGAKAIHGDDGGSVVEGEEE